MATTTFLQGKCATCCHFPLLQPKPVRFAPQLASTCEPSRRLACLAEQHHAHGESCGDVRGFSIPHCLRTDLEDMRTGIFVLLLELNVVACPHVNAAGTEVVDQDVDLFAVVQTLLEHPIAAIGVSVAVAYLIPQLTKITLRFVVVPSIAVLATFLILSNPEGFGEAAHQVLRFVQDHPYQMSLTALGIAGLVLSPYILLGVAIVVIVQGYQLLPQSLKPLAPKPILQAEQQLESIEASSRSGINAVSGVLEQASKSTSNQINQLLDPIIRTQKSVASKVDSAVRSVQENTQEITGRMDNAISVTGNVVDSTKKGLSAVSTVITDATKCTQEPTQDLRRTCVEKQKRDSLKESIGISGD